MKSKLEESALVQFGLGHHYGSLRVGKLVFQVHDVIINRDFAQESMEVRYYCINSSPLLEISELRFRTVGAILEDAVAEMKMILDLVMA